MKGSPLTGSAQIVKDRILARRAELTAAERTLAEVLLKDYPVAGLQSVTRLAGAAGVSSPTVIRMARKLGFDGFTDLQNALREEAAAQIREPIARRAVWAAGTAEGHVLNQFAEAVANNLRQTLDRVDAATFDAVAALLADPARRVQIAGGRITRSNADYLFNHLQIIRPDVTLLSQSANVWPQYILDMGPDTVLVLFDIRRYEADLARLAGLAAERGAEVVLFTDQWGSPLSSGAAHVFNAHVEAPSSWDSTIAIMLLVEALIAEVQAARWDTAKDRIEALEQMFSATRLFRG
ncbi:MurR/RpiR family transcriptional regulator [Pseudooceanicola sp.]|uniref:MurR/RpiR family transcriptional regulator n=1 Tax=Pseudooceanicola sp. TaxID=1914328 RepID=UPI002636BF4E|nr:MurR/RpiR family transcriptional regulator [Pseudooceanicola sp.]MDF1856007.1 MurR/RpiR family transcriptional regulator [Pseudooceanicola sp.]